MGEENCVQVSKEGRVTESIQVKDKETNKYELLSGTHISAIMEEPKNMVFSVQEFYMGGQTDTEEAFHQDKAAESVENVFIKQEETSFPDDEERVFTEYKFMYNCDTSIEVAYILEDRPLPEDSELDTTDPGGVCDAPEILEEKEDNTETMMDQATFVMENQTFYSDDDYIELKLECQNSSNLDEDMYSIQDLMEPGYEIEEEDLDHKETKPVGYTTRICEEPQVHNLSNEEFLSGGDLNEAGDNQEEEDSSVEFEESSFEEKGFISDYDDDEDEDDLEFSKEHEDFIEQLRMDLRNARTGGLPTIMEESESPQMVEELKPLNIDKKLEHKDRMVEIHKFYRSYLNKMQKLDVLNSQTKHAIGKLINNPLSPVISLQMLASSMNKLCCAKIGACKTVIFINYDNYIFV